MKSSGLPEGFFERFLPVERRQLIELVLIGHRGQALQHVLQIGVRFHAVHPAVLNEGANDRVAPARFFGAEE